MQIELMLVPYDSGHRGFRMGRGPEHIVRSGLVAQLEAGGHQVGVQTLETAGDDVASAFDLARQISNATRSASARGALPVILAGNCIATLGGFAGLDSRTALLWLDAHADFNTPETSPSGFLDGMSLAVITGRCLRDRSSHIPGFRPLAERELIMLGTRSVDDGERPILEHIAVTHDAHGLRQALQGLSNAELYVHIDLDVLDPPALRANQFATPGGLTRESLLACVSEAASRKSIVAVAFTAYDPDADAADAGPSIISDVLRILL